MAKRKSSAETEGDTRSIKQPRVDPIKIANELSEHEFEKQCLGDSIAAFRAEQDEYSVKHYSASTISRNTFEQCFKLIAKTSEADYISSTVGWRPRHKKREMADDMMHYLIVERTPVNTISNLDGFCSFMLTYDSLPCVPVLYVYEIHLEVSVRGSGLGRHLLESCEGVARRAGAEKVMLTCFLSNTAALAFYTRLGFVKDATSPEDRHTRKGVIKTDIVILCKSVDDRK